MLPLPLPSFKTYCISLGAVRFCSLHYFHGCLYARVNLLSFASHNKRYMVSERWGRYDAIKFLPTALQGRSFYIGF